MSVCSCGNEFNDEHSHGICFGCKIQGLTFTSVNTGPSKYFLEKQETQQIIAAGHEPIRRSEVGYDDKRDQPEAKPDLGDEIKRQIHAQFHA